MMEEKLRESLNSLRIIGTLKEMNLERKPTKAGDPSIMGNIVVTCEVGDKIHEHTVNIFAKKTSKLYKGYDTVINEYKASKDVGKENATRVQVVGNIDLNEYIASDGTMKSFNRNRGVFINRVNDPSVEDSAIFQAELIVKNLTPVTDKEGIETGEFNISGFTINYFGQPVELKNMIVGKDFADIITENYESNSTGKLTFAINNYVEVEEVEQEPLEESSGFGIQVDLNNEVKNYVNELRIIGGFPPYLDDRAYTDEQIVAAQKLRELQIQEVKNNVPAAPPQTANGFGANAAANTAPGPIDISDDDLPF